MTGLATILHADLDAFYASVEVRDQPLLRGRPVAVGGGVILAATYEARALGVHAPMGIAAARSRCPHLIVVPPRFTEYVAISRQVMELLTRFTPHVEAISIDEAFLDVAGTVRLFGDPETIGAAIRTAVRSELGLPISVGVATTKHLAKIASRVAKPDGLVVVAPGTEESFLTPLPVGHLWGVGPVGERRLAAYGVLTIGDLAAIPESTLATWMGRHWGRHLWQLAHNHDARPVQSGRRAGSVGAQSAGAHTEASRRHATLLALADRVGSRLRRKGRAGRRITVRVRFSDMYAVTRSLTLVAPVAETTSLYRAAAGLVDGLITERSAGRGVSLVGLSVDLLEDAPHLQLELALGEEGDAALRAGSPQHHRLRSLDAAVDRARTRFGTAAVRRAAVLREEPEVRSPAEASELP
ncbi:MAG: DNA polymerase IV [Acidimicrobiia bacterium]|nr:DNA polymerase IV [Acidimicrobiia bacterium]